MRNPIIPEIRTEVKIPRAATTLKFNVNKRLGRAGMTLRAWRDEFLLQYDHKHQSPS